MNGKLQIGLLLSDLQKNSENHLAIKNDFFDLWTTTKLESVQLEIVFSNYFARTINTTNRVTDVMRALINPEKFFKNFDYCEAVVMNLQNLMEELGYHSKGKKAHVLLLKDWINIALEKSGSKKIPIEKHYQELVTQETNEFIIQQFDLYNNYNPCVTIGTSFAQEFAACHMMENLKKGYVNNYINLFQDSSELYNSTEYFAAHVFGVEEEHAKFAKTIIESMCETSKDKEDISFGFNEFLNITANYWNGIYKKLLV